MSTELDLYNGGNLSARADYARLIAGAGSLLPSGVRDGVAPGDIDALAARAFLQFETGSMLGIHPLAALSGINVIEGKPTLAPILMAAVVRRAGHKIRQQQTGTVEGGDLAVTVTLVRHDDAEAEFSATWTPHRAARAGLCAYTKGTDDVWRVVAQGRNGGPKPWQSYTEGLCYARALSEACRMGASDALFGIGYTPEELGADVDAGGNAIDAVGEATQQRDEQRAPTQQRKPRGTRTGQQGTRKAAKAEPEADAAAPTPEPEQPAAEPVNVVGNPMPEADPGDGMMWALDDEQRWAIVPDPAAAATLPETPAREADERAEREALAAEQAANAERLEREAEQVVEAEVVPDDDVPMYADPSTGEVPDDEAPWPADEPPADDEGPSAYELAVAEEPDNYQRRGLAATLHTQLRDTWMRADRAKALTPELRAMLQGRKAETTNDIG